MSEPGVRSQGPGARSQGPHDSPADYREPVALVVRVPRGIRSKKKLFAVLADKLRFPQYFGWNWDAVEECLRDLSWLPAHQPVEIVHEDWPFGAGGENRGIYRGVLCNVADHWAKRGDRDVQIVLPDEASGDLRETEGIEL